MWLAQCLFDRESWSKNEKQAFLLKLNYGAVKDLVPTPGNKEWQSISTRESSLPNKVP